MSQKSEFLFADMKDLLRECTSFHEKYSDQAVTERVQKNRFSLSGYVEAFHKKCGTLNFGVQRKIHELRKGTGIVLMTAHQPNLFAYNGIMRKATLSFVLAKKLEKTLGVPTVSLFGVADQDFTDDRWVKSAALPDVERRNGVLELRLDLPEKLLLNHAAKPSERVLTTWKKDLEDWLENGINLVRRTGSDLGLNLGCVSRLKDNFGDFWGVVDDACENAENFSDFNAFVMSKIVNEVWGYDTLFARFSDCQQIFEHEFGFLLSHFEEYSGYVKDAIADAVASVRGVSEDEHNIVPFWYNCDCGSKARLSVERNGGAILGHGNCLRCGREYRIDFGSTRNPEIAGLLPRISARSLSMPLVFFDGLNVCCYVGGVGGQEYLRQAKHVAENLGIPFPPVAIWRPRDLYLGIAQLGACLTFRRLSGSLDFRHYDEIKTKLKEEIAHVDRDIEELEVEKNALKGSVTEEGEEAIARIRVLSAKQNQIRKERRYSLLSRNLALLHNVLNVMKLYPSIIDCAVNVGLRATSDQWINHLENNGSLLDEVHLKTVLGDFSEASDQSFQCLKSFSDFEE
jgi:hypothetical protein